MKAILIDDSRLARQELKVLLQDFPAVQILAEASNAMEAEEKIEAEKPDVIFLDIEMPGKNGFELLENLHYIPKVIFTTAYNEYALRSFEYNALDYLLKPIQPKRLAAAIEKLQHEIAQISPTQKKEILSETDQVFVKEGEQCWFVRLQDIRLFKNEGNYSQVFFDKHSPLIPRSLQYLEQRLDPKVFFRANRQYILNLKYIDKIDVWFSGNLKIWLTTGEELEISRRQAIKFKELMSF